MNDLKAFGFGFFLGVSVCTISALSYLYVHPITEHQYIDKPFLVPYPKFVIPNSPEQPPVLPELP